jgi:hypothetical protein
MKGRVPQINSFEDQKILENTKIFQFIFKQSCTMFRNLRYLNFGSFGDHQPLTFDRMASIPFSSNLLELHVAVDSIDDCLYLLDDHFNQLHKFDIRICGYHDSPSANYEVVSCSLISFFE